MRVGNRRSEECRDHPYLRPSPYMHIHGGQLPGMPLLKDGRGMDINGADPRMNIQDLCNQGIESAIVISWAFLEVGQVAVQWVSNVSFAPWWFSPLSPQTAWRML